MSRQKITTKGAEALFAGAFIYAFTGVLVREVAPMWTDKGQVFARWGLVFIGLLVYSFFRTKKARVPRNKLVHAAGLGVSFALIVLFFTAAINKTTLANTLFVFYASNMIMSFMVGTFVLKEKVSRAKLVALALSIAGLAFYSNDLAAGSLGIVYSVLAGVFAGVSNVQQKLLAGVDRTAVMVIEYGVGSLISLAVIVFSGDRVVRTASLKGGLLIVLFGLVLVAGSNVVLYGYQHFDVNIGTVLLSTELIWGALMGWLLFGEVPKIHELTGGLLIFTGSVIGALDFEKLLKAKPRQARV